MTSRDRIIQFVEYKKISKNKFYKETGLSNGFLDKNNHPGADKLEQIIYTYPNINPEWLLTGKGEMLRNAEPVARQPANEERVSLIEMIKQQAEQIGELRAENKHKNEQISLLKDENEHLKNKIGRLQGDFADDLHPIPKVYKMPNIPSLLVAEPQAEYKRDNPE